MNVPNWWQFALLFLAAYRIFRLISEDTILDGPRSYILRLGSWKEGQALPKAYRQKLADFIVCPWCAGFWITCIWWGCWQAWPHWTLIVAVPWALSAAVGSLAHALHE